MRINSPANVALFYSFILDVSSFNLLDVGKFNQILFDLSPDDDDNDVSFNPYFDRMGYTSINMIKNIGLIFYIYFMIVIVAVVSSLLRLLFLH